MASRAAEDEDEKEEEGDGETFRPSEQRLMKMNVRWSCCIRVCYFSANDTRLSAAAAGLAEADVEASDAPQLPPMLRLIHQSEDALIAAATAAGVGIWPIRTDAPFLYFSKDGRMD